MSDKTKTETTNDDDMKSLEWLSRMIEHAQVTLRYSSIWNDGYNPWCVGINQTNGSSNNSWIAGVNDKNQYLICGSHVPRQWRCIAIQGRYNGGQWVKSFKIRYSTDNVKWNDYMGGKVFNANTNDKDVVYVFFNSKDEPLWGRSIMLMPVEWNYHISMRLEVYCNQLDDSKLPAPKKRSFTQIGQIESGMNSKLNEGTGNREVVLPVKFNIPFPQLPKIALNLDTIDTSSDDGQTRVSVQPRDITPQGFNAVFQVWGECRAFNLRADYVATNTLVL